MSTLPENDTNFAQHLCGLAAGAGRVILEIYNAGVSVRHKEDSSPVTNADHESEKIIKAGLRQLAPDIPILAEESAADGEIPELGRLFFLVDPLDGTKEFINKTGEFTVNIALIRDGEPVFGVVYAPAAGKLYCGSRASGAVCHHVKEPASLGPAQKIQARKPPANGLTAVASRSHRSPETDAYLKGLNVAEFAAAGSSLKFRLIAEGKADIYPRFGRTMEWDTAAGQAVLEAAGGKVLTHPEGRVLAYGKKARGFDNPYFIAHGADGN